MLIENMTNTGQAYGYFDCNASARDIEEIIPNVREEVNTPSGLELSLVESPNGIQREPIRNVANSQAFQIEYDAVAQAIKTGRVEEYLPRFNRFAQLIDIAKGTGAKYMLSAKLPGATDEQTADELSRVMIQMYQSPLYEENEPFRGEIVYQKGNDFYFRD